MKIFLVIPTLKQGGAERVMSVLANLWAKQGYEVHLVLLAGGDHFYALNSSIVVHALDFKNNGVVSKLFNEGKTFLKLRSLIKKERPVFILSFMTKYNIFTIAASLGLNVEVFISDRSNPRKNMPFLLNVFRKVSYPMAAGIIAQTNLAKDIFMASGFNGNIRVIFNPILEKISQPDSLRENIILSVGRLVPEKGQEYLLRSFAKTQTKEDWQIVILGEGPLRSKLELLMKELGIEEYVHLAGSVQNVDYWFAKASVFAFPSVSEGFPNALVESMAAGLPAISFDCDTGPRDIIFSGENGFLVPVGDVDEFSRILELLMQDKQLREVIGANAKTVISRCNAEKIGSAYLEFCTKRVV